MGCGVSDRCMHQCVSDMVDRLLESTVKIYPAQCEAVSNDKKNVDGVVRGLHSAYKADLIPRSSGRTYGNDIYSPGK